MQEPLLSFDGYQIEHHPFCKPRAMMDHTCGSLSNFVRQKVGAASYVIPLYALNRVVDKAILNDFIGIGKLQIVS